MNDMRVFNNTEFGEIRTLEENGGSLFCGSDVAKALGYTNAPDALARHCRAIVKRDTPISGKLQPINFISEGDVYRLIVHSKLPSAELFERWVFDEVLPTLRKHGAYLTTETMEKVMNDPDAWIKILSALKDERAAKERLLIQAEADKPKVVFADAVSVSDGTILIGELAKILKGNGIDIGQNRLFEKLRQNGFLIKRNGSDYNAPTQMAMELGLFKVKETAITHSDGHVTISKTTKVTGRGQQYFINRFLRDRGAVWE